MKLWKRILNRLPAFVLLLLLSSLLWTWIYFLITDAPAAKKVTVFVEAEVADRALAARLEEDLPEGIRMVKVHPFSYAMVDADTLLKADVFLIASSHMETYLESLHPLGEGAPDGERFTADGVAYGIKVYDASSGSGIASGYISLPSEDLYLCFGRESVHLGSWNGSPDDAALDVAAKLAALP